MSDHFVSPHSTEAERSILAAILFDNAAIADVAAVVSPADFHLPEHGEIFRAMLACRERGEPIDLPPLKQQLGPKALEDIGGAAYIASLLDGVPRGAAKVDYFAGLVKQTAEARRAISCARRLIETLSTDPSALSSGAGVRFAEAVQALVSDASISAGLPEDALDDAVDVVEEGRRIAAEGVKFLLSGVIPNYGMLGMLVAYAKTGKSTFGQAMGAAIAMGRPFLDRDVMPARVLDIAAEDPKEYTAYVARSLDVDRGRMRFFRRPIALDTRGLASIAETVRRDSYGMVLISSWQSVTRGLLRDENDNAGAVRVVEDVKAVARATGVPWLIDAHSGKGEDQNDDADPLKALRGASAAAGAADFMLSLRYANGTFGTQRRLSGKGRFVSFAPITIDYDVQAGAYSVIGETKHAATESTWRLITEAGAITSTPRTAAEIASHAGMVDHSGRPTNTHRRQVQAALRGRSDVGIEQAIRYGQKTTLYKMLTSEAQS